MKDRIIKLDDDKTYYVLEKITLDNKIYIMMTEYNMKDDVLDTENFIIKEVEKQDDKLALKEIENHKLGSKVAMELLKKYREEN